MLAHIDYHFDVLDTKIANADIANYSGDFKGIIGSTSNQSILRISENEIQISELLQTQVKLEDNEEIMKTDESSYELSSDSDERSEKARKKTKRKVQKKGKIELKSESNESDKLSLNYQQCPLCGRNYKSSLGYQKHLKSVHSTKKVYQCYMCGSYFKNLTALKAHLSTAFHSKLNCYQCEQEPPITNELLPRPHKCCFCKIWLENHLVFRKHFKDEHQQDANKFFNTRTNCNEWSCYICKKDFLYKYYLKNHMIIHNDMKPFVCDVCGKNYRTKAVLTRHLNVHEGKTYACELCGKTFSYYARLRIHQYSHRTELNYKCTVCLKAFKVQKYLARHMKIHREEKTFACRYCEKRFTFGTGRRAHEISQHNAI